MIANLNFSNAILASLTLMSVVDALPAGGKPIDTTIPAQATRLEAYISQKYDNTAQATSRLASYISDKQVPTVTLKTLNEPTTRVKPTPSVIYESFKPELPSSSSYVYDPWYITKDTPAPTVKSVTTPTVVYDPWYLIHPTSATYDDGKYHPPTKYDDGKYGKPTSVQPIPSYHPWSEHDFPISWVAPITTYPISDGVPTGVPSTTKKAGVPTAVTDYFPEPTPTTDCTSDQVGAPTIITDNFPEPSIVSILPIPTKITSFVTKVSTAAPETTEKPYTDEEPDFHVISDSEGYDTEDNDDEGDEY